MRSTKVCLLLCFLLLGCSENSILQEQPEGYFQLAQLATSNPGGRSAQIMATALTEFDLGDIHASKEYFFLLSNGSNNPITDITIETDDPRFGVSPKTISTLNAGANDFLPLISLGVTHGVYLNGVGFTDVLEMGAHSVTLTIKGNMKENATQRQVTSTFTLTVNAKLMDIEVMDGATTVDIPNPPATASGVSNAGGLGTVPTYLFETETLKIKNTGNIDIQVRVESNLPGSSPHSQLVSPNQTVTFTLPTDINYSYLFAVVALDGGGTVTHYDRIKLGNDGKGYLAVQY